MTKSKLEYGLGGHVNDDISGYGFGDAGHASAHFNLLPTVLQILDQQCAGSSRAKRLFDLGCGNGSVAAELANRRYSVVGVDSSSEGIDQARSAHPDLRFESGSCYDDLAAKYGQYPFVLSLEVVEHVYAPRRFAACVYSLLEPCGVAIISTPYHGYLKNLVLAATGKFDAHFTALWVG